jgi:hypothetical protein
MYVTCVGHAGAAAVDVGPGAGETTGVAVRRGPPLLSLLLLSPHALINSAIEAINPIVRDNDPMTSSSPDPWEHQSHC